MSFQRAIPTLFVFLPFTSKVVLRTGHLPNSIPPQAPAFSWFLFDLIHSSNTSNSSSGNDLCTTSMGWLRTPTYESRQACTESAREPIFV